MDSLIALCMGVTLSAACGFRAFVPPLAMSIAVREGNYPLAEGFEWIGSDVALITLTIATIVEILAYYIPVVDNFLDTIEIPTVLAVGTMLTAASLGDIDPVLRWSIALVVGGGSAEMVEGFTVLTRLGSTGMTGGLGNPIVSTTEAMSSTTLSIMAINVPFIAAIVIFVVLYFAGNKIWKYFHKPRTKIEYSDSTE